MNPQVDPPLFVKKDAKQTISEENKAKALAVYSERLATCIEEKTTQLQRTFARAKDLLKSKLDAVAAKSQVISVKLEAVAALNERICESGNLYKKVE